jgi:hypothetical protein
MLVAVAVVVVRIHPHHHDQHHDNDGSYHPPNLNYNNFNKYDKKPTKRFVVPILQSSTTKVMRRIMAASAIATWTQI